MLAQRALRMPLQTAARSMRPAAFRAAAVAPFSTKPSPVQQQKQTAVSNVRSKWFAPPPAPGKHMVPIKAAMPQLVPFYFVNEVVFTFTILPLLIYVFSKYILPQTVRRFAARLFTAKL